MSLHRQEWGSGDPLIALHPLALESTAFAGVAAALAARGVRTLAVDLPGFGKSPAPDDVPLTAELLAEPVLELARSLERPPLLLGMSLGGRVALEVALRDPGAVRGLVLVAPYLPLRWLRPAVPVLRRFDPRWAGAFPLERAWPLLRRLAEAIERTPALEHDWLARASARFVYYAACPATRVAFFSAMREMTLDAASGPRSIWSRIRGLEVPTAFLWAGRDALIPRRHADELAALLPWAHRMEVPCAGHFVSGRHFRCMRHAIALAVGRTLADERRDVAAAGAHTVTPCLAGAREPDPDPESAAEPTPDVRPAAAAPGGSP